MVVFVVYLGGGVGGGGVRGVFGWWCRGWWCIWVVV